MQILDREEIYKGLKVFLAKEIEEKNKKRENLLGERKELEKEKDEKKKTLFQTDENGARRKMFSPLNTIFYPSQGENFQDRKIKHINYRIENLEKQVESIDSESNEIKKYLDALDLFMESMEREESKENSTGKLENESDKKIGTEIEVTQFLGDTLKNLQQFIRKQYSNVEVVCEMEDSLKDSDVSVNEYIVEVLRNLIEVSINKMNADAFLIDIKNKEKIQIEVDILVNKEKIDYCIFFIES